MKVSWKKSHGLLGHVEDEKRNLEESICLDDDHRWKSQEDSIMHGIPLSIEQARKQVFVCLISVLSTVLYLTWHCQTIGRMLSRPCFFTLS